MFRLYSSIGTSRIRAGSTVVVFILLIAVIQAALPTEKPWKRVTPDGKYVLVMLVNTGGAYPSDFFDGRYSWATQQGAMEPFDGYTKSGLYPNNGSKDPIWTILSFHFEPHEEDPLLVSDDGRYYVANEYPRAHTPLAFYCDGKLLAGHKSYEFIPWYDTHFVVDLLTTEDAYYGWWYISAEIDSTKLKYTLTTNRKDTIIFDVATGALVERHSGLRLAAIIPFLAFPFALFYVSRNRSYSPRKKGSWNFALHEALVLFTLVTVVFALPLSLRWAQWYRGPNMFAHYFGIMFGSGFVAWLIGRTSRSIMTGAMFGVYAVYVFWLLIAVLIDLKLLDDFPAVAPTVITTALASALYIGRIERRRWHVRRPGFAIY